jgi:hypothetical protein
MENAPRPASSPSPGSKAAGKRKMTDAQIRLWYAKQPRVSNDDSDDERTTPNELAMAAARQASLNAIHHAAAREDQLQDGLENNEEPDEVDDFFDDIYDDDVMVQHPYCPGMRCTERERVVMIELEEARREFHGPPCTLPQHAAEAAVEDVADDGTDTGELDRELVYDLAGIGDTDEPALLVHYRNSAIQDVIKREAVAEILFSNEQATAASFEGGVV